MENELAKIKDLTPEAKRVNLVAKVVKVEEPKEIPSKFGGEPRKVAEVTLGDDTGLVVMSLWNEQIGTVAEGDAVSVTDGYISLVRGHMRLNVGKYGKIEKSADAFDKEVNSELNVSDKEHEQTYQRRGGFEKRSFGGGNRQHSGNRRF